MTISSLRERCNWRLRHTAASCLSIFDQGLVLVENITARDRHRLIILDEIFPSILTGFRIAEFNAILRHFPTAVVYSSLASRRGFRNYTTSYPALASRVNRFSKLRRLKGSAAYVVFLNNIYHFYLEKIEEARIPFAFELYPGGGLYLNDPTSDAHLSTVLASPMFRKVIVTQNVTRDYLLRKKLCRSEQIEFVFGVVAPSDILRPATVSRLRFGLNKNTLDICFIANKYMPGGLDKGYDRFIASARILGRRHPEARFHVVGNFTAQDANIADLRDKITFYGLRPMSFFPQFHARMDLILSPNVPFVMAPGAFDGFPTGCCVDAALCGTAMFVTDELGMNEGRLKNGSEIVIVSPEPTRIAEQVEEYVCAPQQMASLARNGERAVRRLFSLETQIPPRLRILSELLTHP